MRTNKHWTIDRTKYLIPAQVKHLKRHCRMAAEIDRLKRRRAGQVTWMFIHLGLATGLRVSELANVRVGDCRIAAGESHLRVRNGKGGKSANIIVGKSLKRHLGRFMKLKKHWGEKLSPDAYLLISARGGPFTRSSL